MEFLRGWGKKDAVYRALLIQTNDLLGGSHRCAHATGAEVLARYRPAELNTQPKAVAEKVLCSPASRR